MALVTPVFQDHLTYKAGESHLPYFIAAVMNQVLVYLRACVKSLPGQSCIGLLVSREEGWHFKKTVSTVSSTQEFSIQETIMIMGIEASLWHM